MVIGALLFIMVCMIMLFAWYGHKVDSELKQAKSSFNKSLKILVNDLEKAKNSQKEYHKRVIEIEDGIQKEYQVTIRNDITKVECIFGKPELVFLLAGAYKLIESPGSTIDDKEFLINLYKKVQSAIDKMEEPEEIPEDK